MLALSSGRESVENSVRKLVWLLALSSANDSVQGSALESVLELVLSSAMVSLHLSGRGESPVKSKQLRRANAYFLSPSRKSFGGANLCAQSIILFFPKSFIDLLTNHDEIRRILDVLMSTWQVLL